MAFRNIASKTTMEFKLVKAARSHQGDKRRSRLVLAAKPAILSSVSPWVASPLLKTFSFLLSLSLSLYIYIPPDQRKEIDLLK